MKQKNKHLQPSNKPEIRTLSMIPNDYYFDVSIIKCISEYQNLDTHIIDHNNVDKIINSKKGEYCLFEKIYDDYYKKHESIVPYLFAYDIEFISNENKIDRLAKRFFEDLHDFSNNHVDRAINIAVSYPNKRNIDSFINSFIKTALAFFKDIFNNNIQIALCKTGLIEDTKIHEILCIITKNNINRINDIINQMSYSNINPITNINFISDNNCPNQNSITDSYFPFDLILKDNGNCWFLNRVSLLMNKEKNSDEGGCKISNVHIKISSRIHLDTFYEIDPVLQDIVNIYKFAYLIAADIYQNSINDNNDTMIIGYENSSTILIQEIAKIINYLFQEQISQEKRNTVCQAIFLKSEKLPKVGDTDYDIKFLTEDISKLKKDKKYSVYTVISLGTTMSTIFKIHAKISEKRDELLNKTNINIDLSFKNNYSLIAISNNLFHNRNLSNDIIEAKYWDFKKTFKKNKEKHIYVNPEKQIDDLSKYYIIVKYYIVVPAKWEDAKNCSICKNEWEVIKYDDAKKRFYPLIQIDSSNGYPKTVFHFNTGSKRLSLSNNIGIIKNLPSLQQNVDRIKELLLPDIDNDYYPIIYSHICRDNNHYQYYIDFSEIIKGNKAKNIIDWAKSQRQFIEADAINIVVSPLNINNSQFIKIIADNTFSGDMHFLHLQISEVTKDMIKSKLSYLTKSLIQLNSNNSKPINFYYVDDALVTATTVSRAKKLMEMLVKEAGYKNSKVVVFKKLFLLINRNSYETISAIVNDPLNNLHTYINVFTPSYNTVNNICPGCIIHEQYDLLKKRSATVEIAEIFNKLSDKHQKRTTHQYEEWLKDSILHDSDKFEQLKLWLYYHNKSEYNTLKSKIIEVIRNDKIKNIGDLIAHISVNDYDEKSELNYTKYITGLSRFIIAEEAYIRFATMNNAYYYLINSSNRIINEKDAYEIILNMLANPCKNIFDNKQEYQNNSYYIIKCLESYIKVISRNYLSMYYNVRKAIMIIMHQLLDVFSIQGEYDNNKNKIEAIKKIFLDTHEITDEKISKLWVKIIRHIRLKPIGIMQFNLFTEIIRRLALLGSSRIYNSDFLIELFASDLYKKFETKNNGMQDEYHSLINKTPDINYIVNNYITSIKTATMLTDDYASCWRLNEEILSFKEKIKEYYSVNRKDENEHVKL